jgi:hypothetical protein
VCNVFPVPLIPAIVFISDEIAPAHRYNSAFGFALRQLLGIRARCATHAHTDYDAQLEHKRDTERRSDNVPAGQSLYVDATHEVVVLQGACSIFLCD